MKTVVTILILLTTMVNLNYNIPLTTAGVCLVGGVMMSDNDVVTVKYKRKDCPVCKGKGWYISGDGIAKVDCGYCEPEKGKDSAKSTSDEDPDCCKTIVIKE